MATVVPCCFCNELNEQEARYCTACREPLQFHSYRVMHRLAEGGMATVFIVRSHFQGQTAALKVIEHQAWEDDARRQEYVERFRKEVRALCRLRGVPGIAQILEAGDDHGRPFLIQELVSGHTLDRIPSSRRRTLAWAMTFANRLLTTISHIHTRGVAHRDLHPENVLLHAPAGTTSDDGPAPIIIDFGLARRHDVAVSTLPRVAGLPGYASPEQMLELRLGGHVLSGPLSDIYSACALLYYCLVDSTPYFVPNDLQPSDSGTWNQTILDRYEAIWNNEIPLNLSLLPPDTPPDVAAILKQGLAPQPTDRWQDAADLRDALSRACRLSPPTPTPRERKMLERRTLSDVRQQLVLVLIDDSGSMKNAGKVEAANDAMRNLLAELLTACDLDDQGKRVARLRFACVRFATAPTVFPPRAANEVLASDPALQVTGEGVTRLDLALHEATRIVADEHRRIQTFYPAQLAKWPPAIVIVISDGNPTDPTGRATEAAGDACRQAASVLSDLTLDDTSDTTRDATRPRLCALSLGGGQNEAMLKHILGTNCVWATTVEDLSGLLAALGSSQGDLKRAVDEYFQQGVRKGKRDDSN